MIIPLFQFLCFVSTGFHLRVRDVLQRSRVEHWVHWPLMGGLCQSSRCLDHTWWTHGPRRVSIGIASITHSVVATVVQMSVSLSRRVRIQLRAAQARWRHRDSTLADFNCRLALWLEGNVQLHLQFLISKTTRSDDPVSLRSLHPVCLLHKITVI